jgi:hypothetical protein
MALKVSNKRSYEQMSPKELIAELLDRETRVAELESENKRLKSSSSPSKDPAKVAADIAKLKQLAARSIKSQMKWKATCKNGVARWSWGALCDEETFRAFLNLQEKDKTKGKKMDAEAFQEFIGAHLQKSIRYGYLFLRGNANVTYRKDDGEIRINGGYGM